MNVDSDEFRRNMTAFEFKEVLGATASVSTILQFLAGILECRKYIRNGTTGDASSLAFVTCFMSCSLWLLYGILIQNSSIMIVNVFGSSLQLFYTFVFMAYSIKKSLATKQLTAAVLFVSSVYLYSHYEVDESLSRQRVGLLSCSLTIAFFASPLTMLAHVLRVKSSESLPFPIIFASLVTSLQWLLYGVLLNDIFITIPNFMGFVLSAFQLSLFVFYPGKRLDQVRLI